jgi:hypothetical protein
MKTRYAAALLGTLAALATPAQGAVTLFEHLLNIDGTTSTAPAEANLAGFNTTTGLGTVTVVLSGAGVHYIGMYADHEIDEETNTFFNEFGSTSGVGPTAGQTWEIDEPGFMFGDIFANFDVEALDNSNGVPAGSEDDVAMALAWDFNLVDGETATATFRVTENAPGGFYLAQTDPDSQETIYFSSSLRIVGGGTGVPESGATVGLLGLGLLTLAAVARRLRRRPS